MKNYVQPGNTISLTAPYAVASGDGLLVGSIFGVAAGSAASGELVEAALTGVFDITKIGNQAWTVGAKVYWDDTNKRCTTVATDNTLTRADGEVLGFTDHDRPLAFGGTDFEPESGLSASEIRAGSDLSVDSQDAEGALTSDRITETDILDGRWDNALIDVWRVNWEAPGQRVLIRRGSIGELRRGRVSFVAEVRSMAHVLGQTVGRVYQGTCDAALGDSRCGVDLNDAAYTGTGAVVDPIRDRAFVASGIGGFANGWFSFGYLEWTSGPNSGRLAEVVMHEVASGVATVTLLEAPVRPVADGHAFTIRAGCDKRAETCAAKFANILNFRGFPHIPGKDAVIRYATADGGHEGAVL